MPPLPAPRCLRCDLPTGTRRRDRAPCTACADWPPVLVRVHCATALAPPATDLLHALKYEGWPAVVPVLARLMAGCLKAGEGDVAVPVPTTAARLRRRGYNQAGLLARSVAHYRAIPVIEALERRPSAESQIALPVAQRRANVEGVFQPATAADRLPFGCHVILIDDVVTTGATVLAASRALEGIGVRAVTALAFARALPRDVGPGATSI